MSEEQLKAFLEKVKADTNLQEKLKAAADSDAVLAIAKEAGFSISADDLKHGPLEISEEELELAFFQGGRVHTTGGIQECGGKETWNEPYKCPCRSNTACWYQGVRSGYTKWDV